MRTGLTQDQRVSESETLVELHARDMVMFEIAIDEAAERVHAERSIPAACNTRRRLSEHGTAPAFAG